MITKDYILDKLNAGQSIDTIGQEFADVMNAALSEYEAEKEAKAAAAAEAEKTEAKKDLIREMVEIIQEYAILEGMDPNEIAASDDEVEQMVDAFTGMFAAIRDLKALANMAPKAKTANKIVSDDQILADFVSLFN
jgi:hypothetical protein